MVVKHNSVNFYNIMFPPLILFAIAYNVIAIASIVNVISDIAKITTI